MALSNKTIVSKLGKVLEPLLLARDKEIAQLKTELAAARQKTSLLQDKIDNLVQWTRNDSIIISGIQSQHGESNADVETKVLNLFNELELKLTPNDLNNVHRLQNQPNGASSIIVRLVSHKTKVQIMIKKKTLRTKYKNIYINEALTPSRAKLFYEARKIVKDKKAKSAWTRDGQVYVRDASDKNTISIKNIEDIDKLVHS